MNNIMFQIQKYIPLVFFSGLACVVSCFFTMICIRVMPGLGFVDYPDGKHTQSKSAPKAGGLAIVVSFIVVLIIYGLTRHELYASYDYLDRMTKKIFLPALFLCAVGLYDDRTKASGQLKLFGQVMAGSVAWLLGARMTKLFGFELPDYASFALTMVWILAFINVFNMIDSMDGLAGGLGIVSTCCLMVWFLFTGNLMLAVICLTLAGCCLGFLFYNFHPAKIFMGDTGSMFVGFVVAVTGIFSTAQGADKAAVISAVTIPVLAIGVPVFDVFIAIWRRFAKRIMRKVSSNPGLDTKIMGTDREHLHHRLLGRNHNQSRAAFFLYLGVAVIAVSAIFLMFYPADSPIRDYPNDVYPALAFLAVLSTFVFVIRRLATVEMWNSARFLIHGMKQPRRSFIIAMIHPFLDMFIIVIAYIVSGGFFFNAEVINSQFMITMIAVPLLALHLAKCYQVYWMRAGLNNYRILAETLIVSFILGGFASFYLVFNANPHINFVNMYVFFSILVLVLILGERFALRYIEMVLLKKVYFSHSSPNNVSKCVVYGAGDMCQLFLTYTAVKFTENPLKIIGLLDEDPALSGLLVHGHLVFGSSAMLERIYQKHRFDRIVIAASEMDLHNQRRLIEFCRRHNLYLCEFKIDQEILLQPDKTHKIKIPHV
jgi:UDP-GlcNAc:undecaprenyl-phosphate/decaprenyl-phosphate GlcNAc-1-phosphate transferase